MATKKKSKKKTKSARGAAGARGGAKTAAAVKRAADALWDAGQSPHELLRELHDVLLLRCLKEAEGNYAAAAELFGPSRQSVQQYANSPLRDARWKPYQQNRRRAG